MFQMFQYFDTDKWLLQQIFHTLSVAHIGLFQQKQVIYNLFRSHLFKT